MPTRKAPSGQRVEKTVVKKQGATRKPLRDTTIEKAVEEEIRMAPEESTTQSVVPSGLESDGRGLKEGIVGTLKATAEIEVEIVNLARNTIGDTLKATGTVASQAVGVAQTVVKGAVLAVEDVGVGLVGSTTRMAKGIVAGVTDVGGEVLNIARNAVLSTLQGGSIVAAEAANIVVRAANGTVVAVQEIALNVTSAAKDTAGSVIDGVGAVGGVVVKNASGFLVGTVGGVKDVLAAALPRSTQ